MRFLELMRVAAGRGVEVVEMRAGKAGDAEVTGVCEDSRKVRAGDVFVARSGTKRSGAEFAADAIAKGAVAVVSAEAVAASDAVGFVRVENANLALAILAHEVAGNPTRGMKMLAVTGTKGKTTVAYLMRSVLKAAGAIVGMVGTVEIDDGKTTVPADMTTPGVVELVALFSRMKKNGVTHCMMEVSSHALHQDRVAGMDFDVAMFTNLTGDHLDYHGTMEEYAAAKAILFKSLQPSAAAIVNADDAWEEKIVRGTRAKTVGYALRSGRPKLWQANMRDVSSEQMTIEMCAPDGESRAFVTSLIGRHNAYNELCVVAAACELGIPMKKSCEALSDAKGAPGRLQRVDACDFGSQVFVDYAHTHDALDNVLKALRGTMSGGRLICVFGCGGDRDRTKRPKMGRIAQQLADQVVVTSDNPRTEDAGRIIEEVCAGFEGDWRKARQIVAEPDRRAAIHKAIAMAEPGDVVLIAGKGHENYQIIGTTKHHFDDVEEAKAAIELKMSVAK